MRASFPLSPQLYDYQLVMQDLYSTWPHRNNEEDKRSNHRLLRRLRIALLVWLISFIATVIWFSYTPDV